ncbi:hypothetical protein FA15DRAFT_666756 [Coprinopsis marcescibilis]|uniref:Fork-head domain-containing protein n=1 Tax=Coprinopsis marcescibilis TaxID=230819 RepID=A0A5C3LEW0_COPMA|nr:hypothetical protein FA15DRAFT_666756 [Coprinopsis marcescibilis]
MSQPNPAMQAMMQDANQVGQQDPNVGSSNNYYPQDSDITGGLPINLDSLRDGPPGSKPFYPYSTLIRYAIKGSPNGKLLLEDIYYAIESRFPYFRTAPSGWKNSVRHNLSLNPCFEKVPRPLTDRGKGSYWTVNENVDPRTGVHRIRKRKNKKRGSEESDVDYHPNDQQPPQHFEDPHAAVAAAAAAAAGAHPPFVPPSTMSNDDPSSSRPPGQYPPAYPPGLPFDPNFPMMGMRFPPMPGPVPISPDESFEVDEHGNINWRMAWLKEIGHLQQVTQEQEKAGADQEWYRMMLFRVRTALMPPPINPEMMHGMVPQIQPPTGEIPPLPQPPQ